MGARPQRHYDVEPSDLRGLPFGMSPRVSGDRQTANGSADVQARRVRSFAGTYGLPDSGLAWERTKTGEDTAIANETREQIEAACAVASKIEAGECAAGRCVEPGITDSGIARQRRADG